VIDSCKRNVRNEVRIVDVNDACERNVANELLIVDVNPLH
jgi:hypothetical protein